MRSYADFLSDKAQLDNAGGFEPTYMPDFLFDFQKALTTWAIRQGRGALFEDCGLGKTPQMLVWAQNIHEHTGKPVLMLTPLAVGFQAVHEAEKFGQDAALSRTGKATAPITITNYEQLAKFDPADFGGVVCDESSILKSFDGVTKAAVTEFMRRLPYRLLGTATAAPNDWIELGTSSEALGGLGYMDMLTRFFTKGNRAVSSRGPRLITGSGRVNENDAMRLKGHAEEPFWRWVASWARATRRPSDLGFDDTAFHLPDLITRQTIVEANRPAEGTLFDVPAFGLREEREEARRTLVERCEAAAERIEEHDVSIAWCNLNDEGDLLERLIPNSVQVSGSGSEELKEKAAQWFVGELCICNEPAFRAKLAAWHSGPRGTGRTTTKSTESSESLSRLLISSAIARPAPSTSVNTPEQTPRSSGGPPSSRPSTTASGASGTPPTPNSASESSSRPRAATPRSSETPDCSSSSGSRLPSMTTCSPSRTVDAPSAAPSSVTGEGTDSQLTIVTRPESSGVSCAPTATKASASSATGPTYLTAPHCICGHVSGVRRLISKSRIYGFGLNFQHCNHMTYFPSHSYEQWYQAVRRCWRFGQTRDVTVDVIATEGGRNVLANLERKSEQADAMFTALVAHMNDALDIKGHHYETEIEVPAWLES